MHLLYQYYIRTLRPNTIATTFKLQSLMEYFALGVARALSDVEVMIGSGSVTVSWSYDNSRTVNPVPAQYFIATVSQDGIQIGAPFMINVDTTSITIPGTLLQPESTYTVSVVVRNLQGDSEAVSESITIPAGFNNAVGKLYTVLKLSINYINTINVMFICLYSDFNVVCAGIVCSHADCFAFLNKELADKGEKL